MKTLKLHSLSFLFCLVLMAGSYDVANSQPDVDWKRVTYSSLNSKNTSYKRTRTNVELLLQQGKRAAVLERSYRLYASQQPFDMIEQYRWLFTAYRLKNNPIDIDGLEKLAEKMDAMPNPKVREWTRLRFLIGALIDDPLHLVPVGDRLVRFNAQDFDVKYALVRVLANSSQIDDKERAVIVGQSLTKTYSKRASSFAMLGYAYKILWLHTQRKINSDKGIVAYTQFLKVASPNDPYRKAAQTEIKWLRDHTDKNGRYKSYRPDNA